MNITLRTRLSFLSSIFSFVIILSISSSSILSAKCSQRFRKTCSLPISSQDWHSQLSQRHVPYSVCYFPSMANHSVVENAVENYDPSSPNDTILDEDVAYGQGPRKAAIDEEATHHESWKKEFAANLKQLNISAYTLPTLKKIKELYQQARPHVANNQADDVNLEESTVDDLMKTMSPADETHKTSAPLDQLDDELDFSSENYGVYENELFNSLIEEKLSVIEQSQPASDDTTVDDEVMFDPTMNDHITPTEEYSLEYEPAIETEVRAAADLAVDLIVDEPGQRSILVVKKKPSQMKLNVRLIYQTIKSSILTNPIINKLGSLQRQTYDEYKQHFQKFAKRLHRQLSDAAASAKREFPAAMVSENVVSENVDDAAQAQTPTYRDECHRHLDSSNQQSLRRQLITPTRPALKMTSAMLANIGNIAFDLSQEIKKLAE